VNAEAIHILVVDRQLDSIRGDAGPRFAPRGRSGVTVVALATGEILSTHLVEPGRRCGATNDETPADGRGLQRPGDTGVADIATHDSGTPKGIRTPDLHLERVAS
jgi:hypothetical protein